MNSSKTYWAPATAPRDKMALLAVAMNSRQPMTRALHRALMRNKLTSLFSQTDEQEAASLLGMSPEHMPELTAIKAEVNREHWPEAVLNSDLMLANLNLIDWQQEPDNSQTPQKLIKQALDEQTLGSLLETL